MSQLSMHIKRIISSSFLTVKKGKNDIRTVIKEETKERMTKKRNENEKGKNIKIWIFEIEKKGDRDSWKRMVKEIRNQKDLKGSNIRTRYLKTWGNNVSKTQMFYKKLYLL